MDGIFETIKAAIILDESGNRVYGKYYDTVEFANNREAKKFEKILIDRTLKPLKTNEEVIDHFNGFTVVGRRAIDIYVYLVGGPNENEIMLNYLLTTIMDSLSHIPSQGQMLDRIQVLQNYSKTLVIFDEAIGDSGIILEADYQELQNRMTSDRALVNTEDELLNEIGNQTFKFFKQIFWDEWVWFQEDEKI